MNERHKTYFKVTAGVVLGSAITSIVMGIGLAGDFPFEHKSIFEVSLSCFEWYMAFLGTPLFILWLLQQLFKIFDYE